MPKGKPGLVRVRHEEMARLKNLTNRWKWPEVEIVSRLVGVLADLDPEAQAFVLGLPIDEARMKEIGCRTATAIAKRRIRHDPT